MKLTGGLRALAKRLVTAGLRPVPAAALERTLRRVAALKVAGMPPPEGLRFLLSLDSSIYALLDQLAIAYGDGFHVKHRLTRYHDFFVERIRPGERVLDVGCGTGSVALDIAEKAGAWVVGIDRSEESIRTARERCQHPRVRYVVGDVLAALPGERFDAVVLSNILEHLPDRPEFLRKLWRHAAPSRILIRVPLFEREWRVPLRKELGVDWRSDVTHETEYTQETFAREIEDAGMKIVHQETRWGEIWAEVR